MRSVSLYIGDIAHAIDLIQQFVHEMDFEAFSSDEKTKSATVMQLHIMGEAAKHIPEEIRQQYPAIPWKLISGMRDRLSHGYFDLDYVIVWQVVRTDLPTLKPQIATVLQNLRD